MKDKRAAVYLRISKAGQSEHSLEIQRERCVGMVAAKGWTKIAEYSDNGKSGKNMNRPGMQELVASCNAGELDAVVTYDITRFGRNARDLLNAVYTLKDQDIEFVAVRDGIDTSTPSGRLMLTVLAAIAQFDNEQRGEKIKDGLAKRREVSPHLTNKPVFGYAKDGDDLVVVGPEAEDVRAIFAMRHDEHLALAAIAEAMNESGVGTDRTWHPTTVKRALEDERYSGNVPGWPAILEADDAS